MTQNFQNFQRIRWLTWVVFVAMFFFTLIMWLETQRSFQLIFIGLYLGLIFFQGLDNILFDSMDKLIKSYKLLQKSSNKLIFTLRQSIEIRDNVIKLKGGKLKNGK